MEFGRAIRIARTRKNISQRSLAETLCVSHSYISHIEIGSRSPSLKVLTKISEALEVPLHVLALIAASEKELYGLSTDQAMELAGSLIDASVQQS